MVRTDLSPLARQKPTVLRRSEPSNRGESLWAAASPITKLSSDTLEFAWDDGSFIFCFPISDKMTFNFAQHVSTKMPLLEGQADVSYECFTNLIVVKD